jgi:signal peptidase I
MLRIVRVAGASMDPRVREGRLLLVESVSYRFRSPRRGDVAVLVSPGEGRKLLKRIVGVPGDVVAGRRLRPNEYYVRGDNVDASTDSRHFGPVDRALILGRALV